MSSKNSIIEQSRVVVSLAALNRRCNAFHDTISGTLQCLLKLIQLKLLPEILDAFSGLAAWVSRNVIKLIIGFIGLRVCVCKRVRL